MTSYEVYAKTQDGRIVYIGKTPIAEQARTACINAVKVLGYKSAHCTRISEYGKTYGFYNAR